MYKPQIAIIGSRELSSTSLSLLKELAYELVSKGYRTVTGGLGSLQRTVHAGAKSNPQHTDCDTIVLLPGFDPEPAINHADVIIPTGLDAYRNALVANSEVVVAIGGGAGTLSEMAFAWQFKRPIIAIGNEGWADRLAGESLDRRSELSVVDCTSSSIDEIVAQIALQIKLNRPRHQGIL
tara:strand:- start:238 stop:777 length:540 start_codon:yes stop_codon:yes gene_type:complete